MRFIFYIILAFIIYKIIKGYFSQGNVQDNNPSADGEDMVFDPVCKTYIPKSAAIIIRDRDRLHYFCSQACRERYITSFMDK